LLEYSSRRFVAKFFGNLGLINRSLTDAVSGNSPFSAA
jgi:hypothetical protein